MIKGTGCVKSVDDLGRIVIPRLLRKTMNIDEYQPMEFFIDEVNGLIILKKFDDSHVVEVE